MPLGSISKENFSNFPSRNLEISLKARSDRGDFAPIFLFLQFLWTLFFCHSLFQK
ncbi:hypothetical protein ANHYDRO_01346 [Anaerococcus hydrogenalis DSM 7454]|uniref:Uncharacterized protein n=1 Tax=Anaerococcus hydrogenalis DSM 7454 TaxID=561177 RepID=B6W9S1_9FIRM|nr:hypothetical protein ANHYDRO_01346 [Anaerococcus hydrogenalis DSM 7454]